MVLIRKSLVDKLGERITSGEDVLVLAKDTKIPLEDILAIAHGVYGIEVKKSGALTEEQTNYLRSCIQHRVSYESIGEWLGVEVKPVNQAHSLDKMALKAKPKLAIGGKLNYEWFDALDRLGERSSRDEDLMQESADIKIAFLIGQFGKISSMYATLKANREKYQSSSSNIMEGVRLAEALAQDIINYRKIFTDPSSPIFNQLKGPIEEIEGDIEKLRALLSGRLLAL
jgi:hypothetical protein